MRYNAYADESIPELTSKRLGFCHMPSPSALLIATPRPTYLRNNASSIIYTSIVIQPISLDRVSNQQNQRRSTKEGRIILDPSLGVQEPGERRQNPRSTFGRTRATIAKTSQKRPVRDGWMVGSTGHPDSDM